MSVKSRKRADQRDKQGPSNPLNLQKKAVKDAMRDDLGVAIMLFVFILITMMLVLLGVDARSSMWSAVLVVSIIVAVFIYHLIAFVRRFLLFQQLRKIEFSAEEQITMDCKKVSFVLQAESKMLTTILCVVLMDENGNKFCYIYPKNNAPSDHAKKHIKAEWLGRRIELMCYRNTNIVKRLPVVEAVQ